MNAQLRIENYIEEYEESILGCEQSGLVTWERIEAALVKQHDWTEEGAIHLTGLVRDYGSFILSHGLALAILLDQEDGRLKL